jgi:hypothetical protein
MGDIEKMQPRPFKRNFFRTFDHLSTIPLGKNLDAASRRSRLMSFKGMGKSIQMIRAPTQNADAPAHHSDEFPAGYSLTGCSPALPVSALPAGLDHAPGIAQLRAIFNGETMKGLL